ncbi:BREX-1 system phosphatase PglZ type A [Acinetobacter pollinis]|uniref:BREX-1 system phosphatase PglZ type A n=1 Tax=Acinetobacter pollinis TaxID=2605270 RepID=A0ABU6DXD4_9GAMM|nr:BREX-1 system phosphatase PglZ type A [Acinetobacter pollinis]MEB5477562.1 BREX-1 system phosphatase PglZ type A [Acinetobacter pollinis]
MNLSQLQQGLEQAFYTENHRIVFWYDAEQSFTEELQVLDLNNIQILNMANESSLAVKLRLELQDKKGKYLLYFPNAEPESEKDWLLDIKLYSRCFYADRFSIIFNELGLKQQSLREHLAKRGEFIKAKTRLNNLKRHIQPDTDAQNLDMAMIAVVLKAESPELTHIVLALAYEMVQQKLELDVNPNCFAELEKYQLIPALLISLQIEIGYPLSIEDFNEESPFKLGTFFIHLMTTDFCESLGEVPPWAKSLVIPSASSRATARVFLSRWRDSSKYYSTFDILSQMVSNVLNIQEKTSTFNVEQMLDIMTFEVIEQKIIVDISSHIAVAKKDELEHFRVIISTRLDGYWASKHKDDHTRRKYRTIYTALQAAIDLFSLRLQFESGFHFKSSEDLYKAYEKELYRFDMAYRHYHTAAQRTHVDILKKLNDEIENCYSYWFMDHLAQNWGDRIEVEQRLNSWKLSSVPNQQDFYHNYIKPLHYSTAKRRTVVIISDAFRYEAAVELRDRINEKRYSEASLSSQLGVVPSYTTLGMASLLPHETLEYKEDVADDVFVDGQSSKGTIARSKILKSYNGLAITAETVKGWSREEGREALKDQDLIYVYHNVVDARGDNSSTESETFMAVEHAIDELTELSHKILMHFNTSTIFITADHGFLFQHSKLEAADRSYLTDKPINALKSKKRYVIGHNLPESKEAWNGSTQNTAGTISTTDFWIPKGANRFHFVGGSRFVHGGIMPQEIIVPVLTVKHLRGEKAEQRTKRKVEVISMKSTLKMVNNIQKFDLMQTESISELVVPITLSIAIYDKDIKVSSEETLTFDCSTDTLSERMKQVRLSLSGTDFDRKKDYFLILKDKDLNIEMGRYKVTIDLAFTDDFF